MISVYLLLDLPLWGVGGTIADNHFYLSILYDYDCKTDIFHPTFWQKIVNK